MSRYRALRDVAIPPDAYAEGDEFDVDLSWGDEDAHVALGNIEIIPATYKVIGEQPVFDTWPGDTFTRAVPIGQEQLLLGSHIELVTEDTDPDAGEKGAGDEEPEQE